MCFSFAKVSDGERINPQNTLLQLALRPSGLGSKEPHFDSNHILNSTYFDIYATEEEGQLQYAGHLLSGSTKVKIYNREVFALVGEWLLTLAA